MAAALDQDITIGRPIGRTHPPFVIAELSANHLGSLDRAMKIIEAAAACGCDAIKLQTFTPDTMTLDSPRADFHSASGPWKGRSLWELYAEAATPWEWHEPLFKRAHDLGLVIFSTPFDEDAVLALDKLGSPAFKIASFELVDLELIAAAAATGKPVIMSTGMASDAEIDLAVATARKHGTGGIIMLHCSSGYPTPPEQINLKRMDSLWRVGLVGLSDHTPGSLIPALAVARGAVMIEKHLTLRRADGGPDAGFSLEPEEMAEVVTSCKTAWLALGDGSAVRPKAEAGSRQFRRSIYATANIAVGEPLTRGNIRAIRPGHGLEPRFLPEVLGKIAKVAIERGTPLSWELIG